MQTQTLRQFFLTQPMFPAQLPDAPADQRQTGAQGITPGRRALCDRRYPSVGMLGMLRNGRRRTLHHPPMLPCHHAMQPATHTHRTVSLTLATLRRHALRAPVALTLAASVLAGCLSIRTTGSHPAAGEGAGIAVRVFADDDARSEGRLAPGGIVAVLERQEHGSYVPVFRSLAASWTVINLKPGKYRLRFNGRLDEAGNIVTFPEEVRNLKAKEGQVTEVTAVLSHVEPALIAAGVVTAVVAAILLDDWLSGHDLPTPPLPPPPPDLLDAVFTVGVDIALAPDYYGSGMSEHERAPVVTSHFPESDALVASKRVRVTFALSTPIHTDELRADSIVVVGETSGTQAGKVTYDPGHWWVIWEPLDDLPRNDTFHVTLQPEGIEGTQGGDLETASSFTFRTR